MATNTKKAEIKAANKAREEKRNAIRLENIRRRKDNPGNGSAYISALVFMGVAFESEATIKQLTLKVDNIKTYLDAAEEKQELNREQLDKLFADALDVKQKMQALVEERGLKSPEKSSAYRALRKEHDAICSEVKERVAHVKKLSENIASSYMELRSLTWTLKGFEQVGNGLQKAYIKVWRNNVTRREKRQMGLEKVRVAVKVKEKKRVESFNTLFFGPEEINAPVKAFVDAYKSWKPYKPTTAEENSDDPVVINRVKAKRAENENRLVEARKAVKNLIVWLNENANNPYVVDVKDGSLVRLPKTTWSVRFGIETDKYEPETKWIKVEHGFEEFFEGHWKVFGDTEETGAEAKEKLMKAMYRKIAYRGIRVVDGLYADDYGFLNASPSDQKKDAAVFAKRDLLKLHEEYINFGAKADEVGNAATLFANDLKGWANRGRPIAAYLRTANGDFVTTDDILMMKDVEKVYHHGHALKIGGTYAEGKCYESTNDLDNPVKMFDGQMLALEEMALYGQLSGEGWKGFLFNAKSVIAYFCMKYGLTLDEFYDIEVEFADGRRVRVGDYKILCGDGCWKFDKKFANFDVYQAWLNKMETRYPDVKKLSILRQSDDAEDENKIRRLTRSLIQQWIWADKAQTNRLVNRAVRRLNSMKTMHGALYRMAGLGKDEADRTDLEKLFELCPWLLLNKNVQAYLGEKFSGDKAEAMANKLQTKGQYPYIIQDPVAMLEVMVLGKNPDDPDLGVLASGEISLEGVKEGKEVLAVRFPANFLTAKVLTNVPHLDAFASCGNVAILSVHDDILIVQDGDVDGDEMCIVYDELAVSMTKRMINDFKPYVIVFEHGSKAQPTVPGSVKNYWRGIGDALYSAHHNGQVGIYANLARDCCYLMSIAYMQGRDNDVDRYLLWMAAASTGAILAIDQVKGNAISASLIGWLEDIKKAVKKAMNYKAPYTQQFLKCDVTAEDCLAPNKYVLTDNVSVAIDKRTGNFEFDGEGFVDDKELACKTLFETRYRQFVIHTNTLKDNLVQKVKLNNFNRKKVKNVKTGEVAEIDQRFKAKVAAGEDVGLKDILLYYWHNERALRDRLEGQIAEDAVVDLYTHCRESIYDFAISDQKMNAEGRLSTPSEKLASLYNVCLNYALELTRGNGIEESMKGNWTMFILKIIAPWVIKVATYNMKHGGAVTDDFAVAETEPTNWETLQCEAMIEAAEYAYIPADDELADIIDDGSMDLSA